MNLHTYNSNNFIGNFIDLNTLSKSVKNELIDYYQFLLLKYGEEKRNLNQEKTFLEVARKYRTPMPVDFKFDRDEANER